MTRGAGGLAEERPLVGVVEVDVEIVWEQKLHETQRVLGPRALANDTVARLGCPLHVVPSQVGGVGLQAREDFVLEDPLGRPPIRTEDYPPHGITEYRRRMPVV